MKLHYAATSPYVRKVMIAAHECGLAERLELLATTPETVIEDVVADNPLAQIPTLVTDEGTRIYDSTVICEYFDTTSGTGLFPAAGPERWAALTRHSLGQGVMDATIARNRERNRPEGERSKAWDDKKRVEIGRALDALEAQGSAMPLDADIGTIGVAAAIAYIDLRIPDEDWRASRPALAAWYAAFAERPSMQATDFAQFT